MKKVTFLAIGVAVAVAMLNSSAFAAGPDAKKGEDFFNKKCKLCHDAKKDAKHKTGPALFGVVGRKAGSTDFKLYEALKGSSVTWDDASLDAWLTDPTKFVEGKKTKMSAKTPDAGDRANIIAFLKAAK